MPFAGPAGTDDYCLEFSSLFQCGLLSGLSSHRISAEAATQLIRFAEFTLPSVSDDMDTRSLVPKPN